MSDAEWIKHSETRMHLPELSDRCVDCLTVECNEARTEAALWRWFARGMRLVNRGSPFPWEPASPKDNER